MSSSQGRVAPSLNLCRNCDQFVFASERSCIHCGADMLKSQQHYDAALAEALSASSLVESLMLVQRQR